MNTLQDNMIEFRKQIQKGAIQKAYQGLIAYMLRLKNHFASTYPEYPAAGSLYPGYMDMTYFSILPASLKARDLKIAIVFNYAAFRFEIWLSGKNKQVLTQTWKLFQQKKWDKYKVVEPGKGIDSVVEHILVADPDFGGLEALTRQIEQGTVQFILEIDSFLVKNAA